MTQLEHKGFANSLLTNNIDKESKYYDIVSYHMIGLIGIVLKLLQKESIVKSKAIQIIQEVEKNDFRLSDSLKDLIYNF